MVIINKIINKYNILCLKAVFLAKRHTDTLLAITGMGFLYFGMLDLSYAQTGFPFGGGVGGVGGVGGGPSVGNGYNDTLIRVAVCKLFQLIEGSFGGLIMVIAGISAVVSAAFGAYRAALSLIVVGVGAFILRSLVSLFFGNGFCGIGGLISLPGGTGGITGGISLGGGISIPFP